MIRRTFRVRRLGFLALGSFILGIIPLTPLLPPLSTAQAALAPAGFRTDRALAKPKAGVALADLDLLNAQLGVQVRKIYPDIGSLEVLVLPAGLNPQDVLALLAVYQLSGLVEYAEPDFTVQALLTPNDFRYQDGSLWNLNNWGIYGGVPDADIDAPEGWDIQNTADNVTVAVLDTGVRHTHEDLAANLWWNPGETGHDLLGLDKSTNGIDDDGNGYIDDVHGINAILGTGMPWDDHGHGTHVSGIIGGVGNNSVGVVGVCWRVPIMVCKFIDATAQGSISDAIECIDYARRKGAKIINASWGSYTFTSAGLRDAVNSARLAGIIFVAASGNDNNSNDVNPLFPASYDLDNIVSVAATDRTDTRAPFSNFGPTTVDLGAPGSPIFSCWNGSDSDYRYLDGTSMAAPHVAGVCALIWANQPTLTYSQVISRVLSSTDPLPSLAGKCVTGGRLNLYKALTYAVPVTANFTANPTSGPAPLTVSFADSSTGPVTSWSWNFGDGTPPSNAQNPTHLFSQPGSFTVTLTVSGNNGATSSKNQTIMATGSSMTVSPTTDFSSSGSPGGPFSPASQNYAIANIGNAALHWTISQDQTWVSVVPANGTTDPGTQTVVNVSINSQANALAPGTYVAILTFDNTDNGLGNTTRRITLTVNSPNPGALSVSPLSGWNSSGPQGGPFTPTSQTYTLTNAGGQALNWTATVDKTWISVSAASGTLAPSASTTVIVSLNSRADRLKPGTRTATVSFTNTTNGNGNTSRSVTLTVTKP